MMELFSATCLKVGLSRDGRSPGASEWALLPLELGSRRCRVFFLAAEALVLGQTTAPEKAQGGKVVFFFSSMRQRLQVQVKVNYKLHPWKNPIINFTLSKMPLEVGLLYLGCKLTVFACDVFRKTYLLKIA